MQLPAGLFAPWAALAFLTRLAPRQPGMDENRLASAVPWYPLAGAAVGACAVAPLWIGLAGAAFHAILKDSRIGAFGVMALVAGLCVQSLLAGIACEGEALGRAVLGACGRTRRRACSGRRLPHPS